jgi:hypothetical protein
MSETELTWWISYPPKTLEDLALPAETRETLELWLEDGLSDNILLSGDTGVGKTTIANLFIAQDDRYDALSVDYSGGTKKKLTAEDIQRFVSTYSLFGNRQKLVFIDELHNAPPAEITKLTNLMVKPLARFIVATNNIKYIKEISPQFGSRATSLPMDVAVLDPNTHEPKFFDDTKPDEWKAELKRLGLRVAKRAGRENVPDEIMENVLSNPICLVDYRRYISNLQLAILKMERRAKKAGV